MATGRIRLVLGAASIVALSLGLSAQSPPQDPDARVAKRLLHARGGGVLREESRRAGEHWEVRRDGHWVPLAEGLVVSARLEDDALEEWSRRKVEARAVDGAARTALAEWAFAEGLYGEALAQLDRVLEDEPDHPAALAVLHDDALPIRVPGTATARLEGTPEEATAGRALLLDFAAAAAPAMREVAMRELLRAAADPEQLAPLREELGRRLLDRRPGNRDMAALALRRLSGCTEDELGELLRRSVRDVSPEVRRQATLALRDASEPGLILPLVKALGSRSSAVRTHATQALGAMGHAEAVEPLLVRLVSLQPGGGDFHAPRSNIFVGRQISFVQGFDVEVATQAAIGNPQIGVLQEGTSLDVGVMGVSGGGGGGGGAGGYGYLAEGEALCMALETLTGAKPGRTKADWQRWWGENGSAWVAKLAPAATAAPESATAASAAPEESAK